MRTPLFRWLRAAALLGLAGFSTCAGARPPGGRADPGFPALNLARPTHGEEAINALGDRLPEVARAYGKSEPQFQGWLRRERTLHLDRQGRLYYAEEVPQAPAAVAGVTTPVAGAPVAQALADTFRRHSLPGAHQVIYLDFTGRTLSGTAWNYAFAGGADLVLPPFDFEGGPTVLTDNERLRIQAIWQRVAEDYAPFTVDVTTEDPGDAALTRSDAADENYGVRVLISPAQSYFGNYGGISYVGVFDAIGDFYKPSLVFSDALYNSEKYLAEACAHEAGHALGLSHAGTTAGQEYYSGHGSGDTGWAPIMGASYYRNVTQWSRGEYPLANNPEDQLAIIASYIPYRTKDHGADAASATVLPVGATVSATGLIAGNGDADVFAFWTGAGAITLNLAPDPLAPDLDLLAELFDASGTLLATSNPTAALGAGFNGTLPAGQYFLRVQGTGCGDLTTGYSGYGSLGQYTLTGTLVNAAGAVPPTAVATASVTAGYAPLTVPLDGSASSDPDGAIVRYAWDFGDGQSSALPAPSHIYSAAGTFPVTLTVTDNDGLASSHCLTITVTFPNLPPTAVASATPASGTAPLTVTLSAAGSADPDGSIVSYAWSFGDGATGTGASVQHLYPSAGTYTARLTVTDNRGATGTAQVTIQVQAASTTMRVQTLALQVVSNAGRKTVQATVRITTTTGQAVAGATVAGAWSGQATGSASGKTDATGTVVLTSAQVKKSGPVTFGVTNVSKSGLTYSAAKNLVNAAALTVTVP